VEPNTEYDLYLFLDNQTGVSEISCSEARKATVGEGLVQSGL